jgi:hypothetical protein
MKAVYALLLIVILGMTACYKEPQPEQICEQSNQTCETCQICQDCASIPPVKDTACENRSQTIIKEYMNCLLNNSELRREIDADCQKQLNICNDTNAEFRYKFNNISVIMAGWDK